MNHPHPKLTVTPALLLFALALSGCMADTPVKETEAKSTQEIANEAMNSKGKLTKEQINALIAANAKCTPDNFK